MKKVFKKATATVTAAAMLASLTACGGGAASSATTAAPAADSKAEGGAETTEAAASGIDNKDIKIGVSIWSSTDVLGSQCKLILEEAAKTGDSQQAGAWAILCLGAGILILLLAVKKD